MVEWPIELNEVLAGDQVVALASVTPARGLVITPMTNFAVHDRATGTVRVNSSVSAGKKLARISANPNVALAFHSRHHSTAANSQYVLVQGTATIGPAIEDFPGSIGARWDEKDGPPARGLWGRWLSVYYHRVSIDVAVRRIIVWPDLEARGEPRIIGEPLCPPPPSQKAPAGGTAARVDSCRVARTASQLAHVLLGWVGDDRLPVVVPIRIPEHGQNDGAVRLATPAPVLPPGQRRAGLTAHEFSCNPPGEHQRLYTGWLVADDHACTATYFPHTDAGFRIPPSTLLYRLTVGFFSRRAERARRVTARQ